MKFHITITTASGDQKTFEKYTPVGVAAYVRDMKVGDVIVVTALE